MKRYWALFIVVFVLLASPGFCAKGSFLEPSDAEEEGINKGKGPEDKDKQIKDDGKGTNDPSEQKDDGKGKSEKEKELGDLSGKEKSEKEKKDKEKKLEEEKKVKEEKEKKAKEEKEKKNLLGKSKSTNSNYSWNCIWEKYSNHDFGKGNSQFWGKFLSWWGPKFNHWFFANDWWKVFRFRFYFEISKVSQKGLPHFWLWKYGRNLLPNQIKWAKNCLLSKFSRYVGISNKKSKVPPKWNWGQAKKLSPYQNCWASTSACRTSYAYSGHGLGLKGCWSVGGFFSNKKWNWTKGRNLNLFQTSWLKGKGFCVSTNYGKFDFWKRYKSVWTGIGYRWDWTTCRNLNDSRYLKSPKSSGLGNAYGQWKKTFHNFIFANRWSWSKVRLLTGSQYSWLFSKWPKVKFWMAMIKIRKAPVWKIRWHPVRILPSVKFPIVKTCVKLPKVQKVYCTSPVKKLPPKKSGWGWDKCRKVVTVAVARIKVRLCVVNLGIAKFKPAPKPIVVAKKWNWGQAKKCKPVQLPKVLLTARKVLPAKRIVRVCTKKVLQPKIFKPLWNWGRFKKLFRVGFLRVCVTKILVKTKIAKFGFLPFKAPVQKCKLDWNLGKKLFPHQINLAKYGCDYKLQKMTPPKKEKKPKSNNGLHLGWENAKNLKSNNCELPVLKTVSNWNCEKFSKLEPVKKGGPDSSKGKPW